MKETYRNSDPLCVPKISAKPISIFSFIYVVNLLVQDPAMNKVQGGKYVILIHIIKKRNEVKNRNKEMSNTYVAHSSYIPIQSLVGPPRVSLL